MKIVHISEFDLDPGSFTSVLPRSFYERRGQWIVPRPEAGGPWLPGTQSGAAVAALLASCAESHEAQTEWVCVSLHLEFLRPVLFEPMRTPAMELLREGRKLRILRASLAGTSGVSAIATLVYLKPTRSPSVERSLAGSSERFPEHLPRYRSKSPYFTLVDCRPEAGGFGEAGPGAAWMRMEGDILAGQSVAPLAFAALVADTGSGLSASLPRTHWIYPNVTLSLHLSRRVAPGWLHISAHTRDCKEGVAQVDTVIRDMRGEVARAHQSLYIEQRDVPDARP